MPENVKPPALRVDIYFMGGFENEKRLLVKAFFICLKFIMLAFQ